MRGAWRSLWVLAASFAVTDAAAILRSKDRLVGNIADVAPFYHTGAQIHDAAVALAKTSQTGGCGDLAIEVGQRSDDKGPSTLDVVTVTRRSSAATGNGSSLLQRRSLRRSTQTNTASDGVRAMLVYGEHARELISPESGLHLLKTLCNIGNASGSGSGTNAGGLSAALGGASELKLVLNANPRSRGEVEAGNYCLRTNEDRVDLNRNWGEHFNPKVESDETNPGPSGFSEPETRILRDIATEFQPHLFLTVHSGALLLGTPFGYTNNQPPGPKEEKMIRVLTPISDKYCDCPFGSLAKVINYEAPGNSIDYAFEDLNVPFAFTWEIYANQDLMDYYHWSRKEQKEEKKAGGAMEAAEKKMGASKDPAAVLAWSLDPKSPAPGADDATSLVQRSNKERRMGQMLSGLEPAGDASQNGDCFSQFNPASEGEYHAVLDKWTNAYRDLLSSVSAEVVAAGAASAI